MRTNLYYISLRPVFNLKMFEQRNRLYKYIRHENSYHTHGYLLFYTGKKKVHFLLKNGKEMVEEYNLDTNIVVRRAWKEKIINIGQDVGWSIEIGDSGPRPNNIEMYGIEENSSAVCYFLFVRHDIIYIFCLNLLQRYISRHVQYTYFQDFSFFISLQPFITRRITKRSLEWRIRNLPYPKDIYSVTAEQDTITVRTSNRKYFKKIKVPDLERIGLKPEQDRLSFTHQFQTLIITVGKNTSLYIFAHTHYLTCFL